MVTEVAERVEQVSVKLQQAISTFGHSGNGPFGADLHRFHVKSPLEISEIERFESQFEVTLPIDYRIFLCQVGDGGAGPAYGIFSLNTAVPYQRRSTPQDILKTPFPHRDSFNPFKDDDPYYDEIDRKLESGEITESEADWLMEYETSGTIALCHEGCGHLHRLVVSGPSRGEMWMDSTCSDQGYFSLQASFLDWYERWVDQILESKSGNWWFESKWFS